MSAVANRHLNWNTPLVNKTRRSLPAAVDGIDLAAARGGLVVPMFMPQNGPNQDFLRGYAFPAWPGWGWLFDLSVHQRIDAWQQPEVATAGAPRSRPRPVGWPRPSAPGGLATSSTSRLDPALAICEGRRVGDIAQERGVSDFDAALDIAVAARLDVASSATRTPTTTHGARPHGSTCCATRVLALGASDAGAHMDMMVGADFLTRCRESWCGRRARSRSRSSSTSSPRCPLVSTASRPWHPHRGRLRRHRVLDPDKVEAGQLHTIRHLPAGAPRLATESAGIHRRARRGNGDRGRRRDHRCPTWSAHSIGP